MGIQQQFSEFSGFRVLGILGICRGFRELSGFRILGVYRGLRIFAGFKDFWDS